MTLKPSRIGDPQQGSNCSLSANSGLPSLSVPAGFTEDGLPAGIEFLGAAFNDASLLSFAFAFEQATDHRRAPASTPPLVNGSAPAPFAIFVHATGPGAQSRARFIFDVTTGSLSYDIAVTGVEAHEIYSVSLHRADGDDGGPVVHRLSGPEVASFSGRIVFSNTERKGLVGGAVVFSGLYERPPDGGGRGGFGGSRALAASDAATTKLTACRVSLTGP